MTGYERTMYERDLPGIRKALERIAKALEEHNTVLKTEDKE